MSHPKTIWQADKCFPCYIQAAEITSVQSVLHVRHNSASIKWKNTMYFVKNLGHKARRQVPDGADRTGQEADTPVSVTRSISSPPPRGYLYDMYPEKSTGGFVMYLHPASQLCLFTSSRAGGQASATAAASRLTQRVADRDSAKCNPAVWTCVCVCL